MGVISVHSTLFLLLIYSVLPCLAPSCCLYYSQLKPLNHNRLSRRTAMTDLISCHAGQQREVRHGPCVTRGSHSFTCHPHTDHSTVCIDSPVARQPPFDWKAPCCMECQRAMRKLQCVSVRLSNAWNVTKRKKYLFRFLYHTKDHLVFWEKELLVRGDPFYLQFWVNRPRWSEIADFEPIFDRSASAVHVARNVQLTLIGSPTRRFPT